MVWDGSLRRKSLECVTPKIGLSDERPCKSIGRAARAERLAFGRRHPTVSPRLAYRYGTQPIGVARPSSTAEAAELVRLSRQLDLAIVPQGGNTSLCGGAVADRADAVILSLARMTAIGEPDFDSGSVLVEGGAVLAALHHALEPHGLIFPLHLGAEGSARIGGLIEPMPAAATLSVMG